MLPTNVVNGDRVHLGAVLYFRIAVPPSASDERFVIKGSGLTDHAINTHQLYANGAENYRYISTLGHFVEESASAITIVNRNTVGPLGETELDR